VDVNDLAVEHCPTADKSSAERASVPYLEDRTKATVLRNLAKVVTFHLQDQRVVSFAEAGGGASDGVEHRLDGPGRTSPPRYSSTAGRRPLHPASLRSLLILGRALARA
jgi:hypothetical protein